MDIPQPRARILDGDGTIATLLHNAAHKRLFLCFLVFFASFRLRYPLLRTSNDLLILQVLTNSYTTKAGGSPEYSDNDLNDLALGRLLERTYEQHRLFNDSFERFVQDNNKDVQLLRDLLEVSFTKLLTTVTPNQASIYGALDGLTFLPCPPGAFMKLHSLVNTVNVNMPQVSQMLLMYKDMLVWSDLDQDQTRILSRIWVDHFVRKGKISQEPRFSLMQGGFDPLGKQTSGGANEKRDTVDDVTSSTTSGTESSPKVGPPVVFLTSNQNGEDTVTRKGLVLLQGYGVACLFLIELSALTDRPFYQQLFELVSPVLKESASVMNKALEAADSEEFHYIYFNSMNLAIKSTLRNKGIEIGRETMGTLLDMHESFERAGTYQGEVMVKTANENWIIAKRSESRLLFVLVDQRNKTILDIADHVQEVCAKAFKGVFNEL